MTIAIGMLCEGGAILATDTRVVLDDGSVTQGRKIEIRKTKWGSFAIANASNDGNAAKTLVRRISDLLAISTIEKWDDFEASISWEMTEWSKAFGERKVPSTQLIVSSFIKGRGVDLCWCEPPNTVVPKADGYVAAGSGSAVTDPLEAALFGGSTWSQYQHPQKILRQIAYLMYRAKKGSALCGDRTNAIYIALDGREPDWINTNDLEEAENQSQKLDFLLQMATKFALFSDPGSNLEANAKGIGETMKALEGLRKVVFRTVGGEPIATPIV